MSILTLWQMLYVVVEIRLALQTHIDEIWSLTGGSV